MMGTDERLGRVLIPALQDIGARREVLPYGRYQATFDEIKLHYNLGGDPERNAIWKEFEKHFNMTKMVFGKIAAIWIGGSFITSEQDPHDIDIVYLMTEAMYKQACGTKEGRFLINLLTNMRSVVPGTRNKVDAYLLPVLPTEVEIEATQRQYLLYRGYWDQFWSKARFDANSARWQYPAAGYLEVIVDGYE